MSEKQAERDDNPDYQIGGFGEDISKDTSLGEDSTFIELDYETAAVFKRLANDIYESTEAGIREPLQNSITAVKRANKECDLSEDDGVIEIEAQDGDQVTLTLRDNGIGIKRGVLKQVLTVIGRSQNRDDGELSGKYGMGFLACYKLVGVRGGFLMYSNARKTNAEPIRGVWKPGGFEMDTGDELPSKLGEDEYGTLFEFTLKESVDINDVKNWVSKHARFSTVPIIYTEYDENGSEVFNEDYGDTTLEEQYEYEKSLTIQNEHFKSVCSPQSQGNTLLINSPIERNGNKTVDYLGWNFDIRLQNENGVVVAGPNKGLQPTDDEQYMQMSDERQEKYVPRSNLTDEDITLPEPTGTRDSLGPKSEFWDYLTERFVDEYKEKLRDVMSGLETKADYMDLSSDERYILDDSIDRLSLLYATNKRTKQEFNNEFGTDIKNELISVLRTSKKNVHLVDEGANARKASRKNTGSATRCSALSAHEQTDGDVYMAVSLNQDKMDAVWEDSDDNNVVRVNSSDDYRSLEDVFGWKKLKDVKQMMDQLELSDDIVERLQSGSKGTSTSSSRTRNADKDIEDRHLTIHQSGLNRSGFEVQQIEDRYDGGNKNLVLFPSNTDRKLSNHKALESVHVGIANCIVKVSDYLEDCDNVYTIDGWYDRLNNMTFKTNKGQVSIADARETDNIILHVVGEDVVDMFRDDTVLEEMETITRDSASHNGSYGTNLDSFDSNEVLYVPITPSELDQMRVLFKNSSNNNVMTLTGDIRVDNIGSSMSPADSDIYWYAWARLPRWRDTKELSMLSKNDWQLNPDWAWLIDQISDSDYEMKSITGLDIEPPSEVLKFHTSEGHLSLREIISNFDSTIVHILPLDTVDAFRTEGVDEDTMDYILENGRSNGRHGSSRLKDESHINADDTVYIPVTQSEATDIDNVVSNPENNQYTLGDSHESCSIVSVTGELSVRKPPFKHYNIDSDTAAYAHSRLPQEVSDATIPIENHNSLSDLSDGGLEFIETMATMD